VHGAPSCYCVFFRILHVAPPPGCPSSRERKQKNKKPWRFFSSKTITFFPLPSPTSTGFYLFIGCFALLTYFSVQVGVLPHPLTPTSTHLFSLSSVAKRQSRSFSELLSIVNECFFFFSALPVSFSRHDLQQHIEVEEEVARNDKRRRSALSCSRRAAETQREKKKARGEMFLVTPHPLC
jgi:hypothetical protein